MNFKGLFFDKYGFLHGQWVFLIGVAGAIFILASLIMTVNVYSGWQCENFEKVTGRKAVYVDYDACFVIDDSGEFIRYDGKFKE